MNARPRYGHYRLNGGRIIRLFDWPHQFYALLCSVYLHCAANWKQLVRSYSAAVGPIVPDKHVQFGDPRLNRSREIPPESIEGGIFDGYSR